MSAPGGIWSQLDAQSRNARGEDIIVAHLDIDADDPGIVGRIGAEGIGAVQRGVDGGVDLDLSAGMDADHACESTQLGSPEMGVHPVAHLLGGGLVATRLIGLAEDHRELRGGVQPADHRADGEGQDPATLFPS